jgi:hypothetical protein
MDQLKVVELQAVKLEGLSPESIMAHTKLSCAKKLPCQSGNQ